MTEVNVESHRIWMMLKKNIRNYLSTVHNTTAFLLPMEISLKGSYFDAQSSAG